ncbi:MAG: GntR family transcriptional regulator, partial [Candidatus Obscuribacter sp.]|nr:GntR family transcriptional regulator [Candidatus Obscuribacter sp.]
MDWLDLFDINLSLADERTPLYRRIVDAISGAIESGKLKAGDKLPTNRELASKLKIDRSTASRAYDELSSRGLIKSHVGRGTFVESTAIKVTAPNPVSYAAMPVRSGAIDWQNRYSSYASELYSLMEKQPRLTQGGDVINFAAGIPARHSYP